MHFGGKRAMLRSVQLLNNVQISYTNKMTLKIIAKYSKSQQFVEQEMWGRKNDNQKTTVLYDFLIVNWRETKQNLIYLYCTMY